MTEDAAAELARDGAQSPSDTAAPERRGGLWTSLSVLAGYLLAIALASIAYVCVIFSFYLPAAPFTFAVACQVALPVAVVVGIPLTLALDRRGLSRRRQLIWSAPVGIVIAVLGMVLQFALPAALGLPYLYLVVGVVCAVAGRRCAYFCAEHHRWLVALLTVLGAVALLWSMALWRWF
ncbi:hypothetical protein GCM10022198_06470 [Klugiella xanthotipulae]|uniref:Uncharacterized protein n=1 Tax=Klugiella xanthotipulae TaxID=244735 RepID=A0A543I5Y6_9MICO|nr:hypothetical protein [Klugiella xanthotipulae]TQM66013.1 hypothetical protein FB466_0834 [Klugiella xanthotipulae]